MLIACISLWEAGSPSDKIGLVPILRVLFRRGNPTGTPPVWRVGFPFVPLHRFPPYDE
jgi:hypothetical protein